MACREDPELRAAVLGADFTVPDGQPLVWALRALGHALAGPRLRPRADGPRLRPRGARPGSASTSTAAATTARSPSSRARCGCAIRACGSSAATARRSVPLTRRRGGRRSRTTSTARAPTSSGSGSASRSRRSGWRGCATGSTRRCSSASAPRSTSTPGLVPQAPDALQRLGLEWVVPARAGAAPPVAALPALQPALRARLRPPVPRRRTAVAPGPASLQRDALRRRRDRAGPGRPAARPHLRRPRALRARRRQGRRAAASRSRDGRMPFKEPGTDAPLARAVEAGTLRLSERAADAARGRGDRAHARHADVLAHRDRHVRHPRGARRAAAAPARGPPARAALHGRPAHDRVRGRLPREAPRLHASARTSSSPTCPSGSPPTASWPRSGRCRASSAASARRRASAPRGCSSRSARRSCRPRPCRPSWRRSGRTSCATRRSRCPNLLMMDCERYGANVFEVIDLINRDYPRGGIAQPGLHRRHLPAQGLRVQRGALQRARHAARRLAGSTRACRCSSSRASSAGSATCASARSPCSGSRSRATPTTSATRSRTS